MASNKTGINKSKYTPINTKFKVNDATANDGNVIANKFNKFFVNVGTVLPKSMPPSDKILLIIYNRTKSQIFISTLQQKMK